MPLAQQHQAAEPEADAYDPYGVDEGIGKAPAYRKYGREDFVANRDTTGSPMVDSVAYLKEASDYKHYSRYGIKFPTMATTNGPINMGMEPFADQAPGPKKASTATTPRAAEEQCASKDTMYRIPVSDESKEAYKKAMDMAISSKQAGATGQVLPQMRQADMSKVSGYYDEDLEQYLKVKDMKAAPMPSVSPIANTNIPPADPYDPEASPFSSALNRFNGNLSPPITKENMAQAQAPYTPQAAPQANAIAHQDAKDKDANGLTTGRIIDLILFILFGVLVIFLCDQLYRLALMTGMKDTIEVIKPFLLKSMDPVSSS